MIICPLYTILATINLSLTFPILTLPHFNPQIAMPSDSMHHEKQRPSVVTDSHLHAPKS
ncbi:hypothetical protein BDZ94DRAFT_1246085 [Collybia nuda]|uniref:NADH dehydrogenase subunit 4 n=1 Tax=Collybia nuda TaxID=64659 RepID=A0A9P6CJP7_9AGAR|nr:hypothetical protein BDZ94DRAFT_1246085 [Collybia nuda]